jgi:alkyl hydroperoxide reductase subunit F
VRGVFAAGDCTDTHDKQIVISVGEGATAALAAFEYLVAQV